MADPIGVYYQNAQLSMAVYANLTLSMNNDPNVFKQQLKDRGFTDALATQFVATYRIAADTLVDAGTGLSATLFQNIATGEKILAVRGTNQNEISDLITDGLLAAGEATTLNPQYLRLQLYYLELIAQGKLGPDERFSVTGHSLGGFLAQAFTVDNATTVTHTYTYNAPGTGGLITEVLEQLGVTASTIPSSLITNVISKNGLSLAAGLGTQIGTPVNIFIESTGFNLSFHDHQIATATDALAFYDLAATIDPTVEIATVTNILEAASATTDRSLETVLDALRVLFLNDRTPTPIGPSGLGDANRETYYTNLTNLRSSLLTPNIYRLDSLVDLSSSAVYSQARNNTSDGLAYRYALAALNPFVVTGVDYQALHNQGDPQARPLDLYDSSTGQGTWTLLALSDRAELLAEKLKFTLADGTPSNRSDTLYVDVATGFDNQRGATATQVVIFDADGNDLIGRSGDDHLYGGVGDDSVEGREGRDYIEGNEGNDFALRGGAGDDIILGQQGNDQLFGESDNDRLNGGLGDDRLEGGTGLDTYFYRTGQGQDRIVDTDKIGTILFDQQTLVGGIRQQGTPVETWVSPDGQFTFVKSGTNLVVNTTLTIENFDVATGALGLKLADAGNLIDANGPTIDYNNGQPTVTYDGDATDNTPTFTAAANHEAYGYGGNDILNFEDGSAAVTLLRKAA